MARDEMRSVSAGAGEQRPVDGFEVDVRDTGRTRTVCPRGEIDLATAPAVGEPVTAGLAAGFETVVLDLSRTTFIDSTGIAMVVKAVSSAREGARLVVLPGPAAVQRVFELCGLMGDIPFVTERRADIA